MFSYHYVAARQKAFTLIELLVAAAIIGLLATVGVQSFSESRVKAKDANIRTSVRNYTQSLELYNTKYKTYFVYNHSGKCATRLDNTKAYKLKGTAVPANSTGCVGLDGGGMGRITRKDGYQAKKNDGTLIGSSYSKSIADVLVAEGFLSNVQTVPGVKDFNTSRDDFILTLCDNEGYQARSPETATNYAVYAQVARPSTTDTPRANVLCGGRDTGRGWNVFES
jgi:prepilin-type N-terminal cleavage/methylation domain-containing protein